MFPVYPCGSLCSFGAVVLHQNEYAFHDINQCGTVVVLSLCMSLTDEKTVKT